MRETLKNTTNSSIYKKILTKRIIKKLQLCWYCFKANDSIYGGENYRRRRIRNWKHYRKTQYKKK